MSEYAILPLGSAQLHERLPYTRSLLLFGAERTGKTLLSHVRRRAVRRQLAGRGRLGLGSGRGAGSRGGCGGGTRVSPEHGLILGGLRGVGVGGAH